MSTHTIRSRPVAVIVRAAGVVALPLLAVLVLHDLAARPWAEIVWSDLATWLATARPDDATVALARVLCLGVSYWLLAATTVAVIARLHSARWSDALAQRVTPAALRRFIDRTVVAAATAGVLVSGTVSTAPPAVAAPAERTEVGAPLPPGVTPPSRGEDVTSNEDEEVPRAEGERAVQEAPDPGDEGAGGRDTDERAQPAGVDEVPGADVHTVVAGEHLWGIARDHLVSARGVATSAVTDADVVPYWRAVIAANRASLLSGDPDLIFPGERIVLPPTETDAR